MELKKWWGRGGRNKGKFVRNERHSSGKGEGKKQIMELGTSSGEIDRNQFGPLPVHCH